MNFAKIDPSLSAIMSEVVDDCNVQMNRFVTVFISIGSANIKDKDNIFTATLSLFTIAELSDQRWVKRISLSQTLRPL